jgi:hypothetical protein
VRRRYAGLPALTDQAILRGEDTKRNLKHVKDRANLAERPQRVTAAAEERQLSQNSLIAGSGMIPDLAENNRMIWLSKASPLKPCHRTGQGSVIEGGFAS